MQDILNDIELDVAELKCLLQVFPAETDPRLTAVAERSIERLKQRLDELKRQVENVKRLGTPDFDSSIPLPLGLPAEYWEFLRDYDPVATASALACPVLVLQGERDYQVTMQDYTMWLTGLLSNRRAQLKSYPALNHLLQEGKGKSTPLEYNDARPVPAYVAADVAGFIRGKDIR